MKKTAALTAIAAIAATAFGTPATIRKGSVSATQTASHRMIVNYTLDDGPAIVTFDVLTNGVSIGGAALSAFTGDINRKVESGEHAFHWLPTKSWPGMYFPAGGDVSVSVKVVAWDVDCAPDVMVIDLLTPSNVTYFASLDGLPGGVQNDVYKTDKLVLRKIPAEYVTWKMGSPTTESGYNKWVDILHDVTLTKDFYIGVYEVTQKQWYNIKGTRPSHFTNELFWATRPVESVCFQSDTDKARDIRGLYKRADTWPSATTPHAVVSDSFFGKLRKHSGLDLLDLPSDAQWEYACRAGSGGIYPVEGLAYGTDNAMRFARYGAEGYVDGTTAPDRNCTTANGTATVGSYEANAWGLYDMLGNVREWCLDAWMDDLGTSPVTDPVGSTSQESQRAHRGGSWSSRLKTIRCGSRSMYLIGASSEPPASKNAWNVENNIGFRVCLHMQ